ncbi:MAG: hypothetical protein U1F77_02085 [Kiritimatiellia bacterium]
MQRTLAVQFGGKSGILQDEELKGSMFGGVHLSVEKLPNLLGGMAIGVRIHDGSL